MFEVFTWSVEGTRVEKGSGGATGNDLLEIRIQDKRNPFDSHKRPRSDVDFHLTFVDRGLIIVQTKQVYQYPHLQVAVLEPLSQVQDPGDMDD